MKWGRVEVTPFEGGEVFCDEVGDLEWQWDLRFQHSTFGRQSRDGAAGWWIWGEDKTPAAVFNRAMEILDNG
jgi:hypothetical protein